MKKGGAHEQIPAPLVQDAWHEHARKPEQKECGEQDVEANADLP